MSSLLDPLGGQRKTCFHLNFLLHYLFIYFVCICIWAHVLQHVWRSDDNFRDQSILCFNSRFPGSNSGHQTWWQVPLTFHFFNIWSLSLWVRNQPEKRVPGQLGLLYKEILSQKKKIIFVHLDIRGGGTYFPHSFETTFIPYQIFVQSESICVHSIGLCLFLPHAVLSIKAL